ncbi:MULTISPECIES: hypothetical protein [unclassified Flavobacterium]|uniref:hypothetical protein n=1 Tax=unclassified Flavobacterium TaxID=196869 RepID=UPI00095BC8FC|nr:MULTISPECIES: hypothetical protein [unclassified Flavobacterium]MBN9284403.1 hypothetical protein [Flavobacterium sp.]OJV72707.1 MAG: hypothetical protein BGO42_14840 [Flavobacterium sp. 40-81]
MIKITITTFWIIIIAIFCNGCSSLKDKLYNPVTDLPKKITERYAIDIVTDKEMALKLADIIYKEQYRNIDFEQLKPFTVNLIADGKVWEIIASSKKVGVPGVDRTYYLRINKNTAEVINLWVKR